MVLESTGRLGYLERVVVILVALILVVALAIVARPLPTLFDQPLEEDGYYYMAIARWIALGWVPSPEGQVH